MSITEIQCNLNSIIVNFNDNFKENMKELVDFMDFTLTEYNNMKTSIEYNLAMMKNSKNKKVNKRQLSKASARTRNQCKNDISEISAKNVPEENFTDVNDSIACRTRGAMRAMRESKSTKLNFTHNLNDVAKAVKGRSRVKAKVLKTSGENNVNNKRSAEEEADVYDVSLKKIRQENLNECELSKREERVFKKPLNRGRLKGKKTSDSVKNINSDTLAEDFRFFNNPIVHSSPNASIDLKGRTFVVSPNSISNIKVSPKQDSSLLSLGIPSVKEKVAAFERMGSEIATNSGDSRRISKMSNVNEKITDKCKKLEKECTFELKNTDEFICLTSIEKKEKLEIKERSEISKISHKNSNSHIASTPKQQVIKKSIINSSSGDEKKVSGEGGIIRSSSLVNHEDSSKDGDITKSELPQLKAIHKKDSGCEHFPNEETDEPSPLIKKDLNVTKKITKASKRTKPVLKPTIFDSMGNIIINKKKSDESAVTAAKKNSSEKSYILRSSANLLSTTFKKDSKIKKEVDDGAAPHIDAPSIPGRKNNEENKPESGGKKKGKTAKKKYENEETRKEKESESGSSTERVTTSKEEHERRKSTAPNSGLIILARKSLKKAKRISFHQNKLKSLQGLTSRITPQKAENYTRSTSKSHLVTPLHTITNNIMKPCTQTKMPKIVYPKYYENTMSTGKGKYILDQLRERELLILNKVGPSLENSLKSSLKNPKENELQKEMKLKIIKEKEEEASMKREQAIKSRREELKRKNEMKLQSAMKQRKKLEEVKYNNIIQIEKQKEAKHKQLLEERDKKLKERALKKKQLMEQKLAETEERRRLEEEARIAKLKEQEAEQERIMREKQKELERHEKRAQERLAQEKAKEQYELNLKLEQMKAEKILAAKAAARAQSANKMAKPNPKANSAWNYKPRNENDYGLDDENSELDSDCEEPAASNRPLPPWAKRVKNKEYRLVSCITQDLLMEFMPCYQKTPDIHKMFKMTPNKRIKRTSSAIWNTPSS